MRIRYSEQPLRETAAWLIPGADPAAWLAELARWETPLADVILYVVPRSAGELAPQGALAVLGRGCAAQASGRCRPYGRIGGDGRSAVYLPVEARFDPEAPDAEVLEKLAETGYVYVFHPSAELIGFEPGDATRASDWLQPPPEAPAAWDRAQAGLHVGSRLTGIDALWTPSIEAMLDEGRDDIGSLSDSLQELPPLPEVRRPSPLTRAVKAFQQWRRAAKARARQKQAKQDAAAKRAAGKADGAGTSGAAGIFRALGHGLAALGGVLAWAFSSGGRESSENAGPQAGEPPIDERLLQKRDRELARLLKMLENDPDQGLRYAPSFGPGGGRDSGTHGANLASHDVDFNLGRLGGGESAEYWQIAARIRERLLQKYHELAARELRLGRYRRAAYIYAELLGDLNNAAAALVAGRHWREAAALYRDRLGRPDQAAHCLEQGGLWTDAIALYEELGALEKAGDLYRKLDQPEAAEQVYRKAIARHVFRHDHLAASRMLVAKLDAVDEAVATLREGWSSGNQTEPCLEELFRLLGERGRHDEAKTQIEQCLAAPRYPERVGMLADVLSRVATTYPNDPLRAVAADATRTLAASRLRTAGLAERTRLVEAVGRLVPSDRLLERDCRRYLHPPARHIKDLRPAPPEPPAPRAAGSTGLELVRQFQFSPTVEWRAAVSAGEAFYVAGYERGQLVVEQGFWDGAHSRLVAPRWHNVAYPRRPILMVASAHGLKRLVVCLGEGPPLPEQSFPVTARYPYRVRVGSPPSVPTDAIALDWAEDGTIHALQAENATVTLQRFARDYTPLGTVRVPLATTIPSAAWPQALGAPVPFHARSNAVYFAPGEHLVIHRTDERRDALSIVPLPHPATSLDGSRTYSRIRVAVGMELGAVFYWDEPSPRQAAFANDMVRPVVRFVGSDLVVAASADSCALFLALGRRIHCKATCPGGKAQPLAVLETDNPNHFAVVSADGWVRVYSLPPR